MGVLNSSHYSTLKSMFHLFPFSFVGATFSRDLLPMAHRKIAAACPPSASPSGEAGGESHSHRM